jgi:hypothetical protein
MGKIVINVNETDEHLSTDIEFKLVHKEHILFIVSAFLKACSKSKNDCSCNMCVVELLNEIPYLKDFGSLEKTADLIGKIFDERMKEDDREDNKTECGRTEGSGGIERVDTDNGHDSNTDNGTSKKNDSNE